LRKIAAKREVGLTSSFVTAAASRAATTHLTTIYLCLPKISQIDGIDVMTAMTVISEVGEDMNKWKTENHFVSWLKLSPDNKISGGKVIGKGRMPTNNRATSAFKMAASAWERSSADSEVGWGRR
jgi:transposase